MQLTNLIALVGQFSLLARTMPCAGYTASTMPLSRTNSDVDTNHLLIDSRRRLSYVVRLYSPKCNCVNIFPVPVTTARQHSRTELPNFINAFPGYPTFE